MCVHHMQFLTSVILRKDVLVNLMAVLLDKTVGSLHDILR